MIRKLKPFFLFIVFAFVIVSCKKKNDDAKTTATPSTSSPQPYSEIKTKYTYSDNGTTVYLDSAVRAVFYDVPWNPTFNFNFVSAGNITLNDSTIDYSGGMYGCGNPCSMS